MKQKIHCLLAIICALLVGCSEELVEKPYAYTRVFTGESKKGWTIRSIQLLEEGKGTITFSLAECVTDDIYVFYANAERKYEVLEGATKCDPDDPAIIVADSWSFVNASATLNIIFPLFSDSSMPFIVREAEDDKMTLEIFPDSDKSSYRINFLSSFIE